MTEELRKARTATPGPGLAFMEAYNLFCLGRDAEAGALADSYPEQRQNALLRVLVALGRPDGRADARRAWERYGGAGRAAAVRLEAAPLLFVVGEPGEVAALARDLRSRKDSFRFDLNTLADHATTLAFLEGTASEEELLRVPGANQFDRFRRHYLIGWKRLGEGDRAGAVAAFEDAYGVMMPGYMLRWITRAMLIRMRDPSWPRAVRTK
jgi:hypothetical protein